MANGNTPNFSESSAPKPFKISDDPTQKRIYDRLNTLVGAGAATFYKDACRLMVIEPKFVATTHIVSHLLREIESALRSIIQPLTNKSHAKTGFFHQLFNFFIRITNRTQPNNSASHKNEIRIILSALEFQDSDPVTRAWLQIAGAFPRNAHRKNLSVARPIDDKFVEFWDKSEIVLDNVLDRLEANYTKIFDVIDQLANKQNPTKSDAQTISRNIPNNFIAHQRFFEKLSNPKWLPLLKAEGLFSEPPSPEYDEEQGGTRHMPWPEAIYLEKMAAIDLEAKIVTGILKEVKDIDNSNAKSILLKAAANLPKENRLELIEKLKSWIKTEHQFFQFGLIDPSTKVINKFLDEKEEDIAFQLAGILLEILPDKNWKPAGEKIYAPHPEPRTRLEHWHYGEFLKKELQKLVDANPKKTFDLVCQLLADYLKFEHADREEKDHNYEDLSSIWRPAIESHEQNHDRDDIKNELVTAIRDIGKKLVEQNPSIIKSLYMELESKKWTIFRRIGLHLLSEFPDHSKDLVSQQLLNKELFDDTYFEHDYTSLMHKKFRTLSDEEQKIILGWINDTQKVNERIEESKKQAPIEPEKELRFKEVWQRDKLYHIKDDLSENWKKRYAELVKKYGEPDHPGFPFWSSGVWVGPTSDVTAQELADMDIDKLIDLLKNWQPKKEPHGFGPTKEGMGRELGSAIKLKPEKFKDTAEKFKGLDPTYVRAYIQTFYELAQNNGEVNWPEILDLCSWVLQQPRVIPDRTGEIMDQDPDWSWTRKTISSLISRGANSNVMPCQFREQVWKILEPLTHDPDPTPEDENKREENSDDAYTFAINCARGEAMNAVVEYALWVYRCIEKQPDGKEKLKDGFDVMSEVKSALEWHLSVQNDPSIAVRAVYGRFFPWLLLIDKKWTHDHLDMILPPGQFDDRLYAAAWNTLMLYVPAYNDPFEVLKERYREAIDNLGKVDKSKRRFTDRDERLAEHLILFYIREKINLSDLLLINFFNKASDELRAHALGFVGRSLKSDNQPINTKILERLRALWENRIAEAKKSSDKSEYSKEMAAFGWWFASGKFDDKWSCNQYLEALEIGKGSHSDHFAIERLLEIVKTYPTEAVKILGKIALSDQPGWIVLGNKEEVNSILSGALGSSDTTAKEEAGQLVNRLVAKGYTEFNLLLSNKSSDNKENPSP